jgi:glycosyltransferase involved in cell wall biosynthesis
LVLPSFDEGYGLPAVEAAACGTPVIATTSSPIPRLLEGGGIFFDPRDVNALKDALAVMCGDDQARENMADMALERASTLTWARAAHEFHTMMEEISKSG